MSGHIKRFWMRLDRRLIALICLAVLPINLLAIWFCSVAVRESQEKVRLARSREFTVLVSQEMAKLQSARQWYADFVQSNLDRLLLPRCFSAVFSIQATNQMAVRLDELVLPGFVFVQEHSEEKKLYVRPTGKLLSVIEAALLKTELQPFLVEQQAKASDSAVVQLCDRPYHIVYYVMNNDISRK